MCRQTPRRCLDWAVVTDGSVTRLQSQKWLVVGEKPRSHSWSENFFFFFQAEKVCGDCHHVLWGQVGSIPERSLELGLVAAPAQATLCILSLSPRGKSPTPSLRDTPFP